LAVHDKCPCRRLDRLSILLPRRETFYTIALSTRLVYIHVRTGKFHTVPSSSFVLSSSQIGHARSHRSCDLLCFLSVFRLGLKYLSGRLFSFGSGDSRMFRAVSIVAVGGFLFFSCLSLDRARLRRRLLRLWRILTSGMTMSHLPCLHGCSIVSPVVSGCGGGARGFSRITMSIRSAAQFAITQCS